MARILRFRIPRIRTIDHFLKACIGVLIISACTLYLMESDEDSVVKNKNKVEDAYASFKARRALADDTDMSLPLCDLPKPAIISPNDVEPTWEELERNASVLNLEKGGRFRPKDCRARQKIAIVVPYRNRETNLKLFLQYMHPFLQRQNQDYVVYVIEMEPEGRYRKTVTMNSGFKEVSKLEPDRCIILHDVDMVPMNTENVYFCDDTIRHPAIAIKQYNFSKPYPTYIGGVLAFPEKHYRAVNGFSNVFIGWGGEEDDLNARIEAMGITVWEPDPEIGKYATWPHAREDELLNRKILVTTAVDRMRIDGYQTVKYSIRGVEERPLFTWIGIQTNHTNMHIHRYKPQFGDWLSQVHVHFTG